MTTTHINFIKFCGATIPMVYSGDASSLNSFLNALDLLSSMSSNDLNPFLISFIKTRLSGLALEAIENQDASVDTIKKALIDKIKPESDKVIRGRLAALRTDKSSFQDFAKEAESLAECLRRSLISEGISVQKANSMAIDEVINTCKASANSDHLKIILASSQFDTPKDVIAKFVIESENEKTSQILALSHCSDSYSDSASDESDSDSYYESGSDLDSDSD